jgi:hypothetical protein
MAKKIYRSGNKHYNKKFWEKLITHFPLIRHGTHRKRLQQLFVAAGTSLPYSYLATIRDTQIVRQTHASNILESFCIIVAAGTCLPNRCLAMKGTYIVPSLCLATIRRIHIQTHKLMGGISGVRRWDGLRFHGIHSKFHKDCFRHGKCNSRGFTNTQAEWRSHKPTLEKYAKNDKKNVLFCHKILYKKL